mgnify:CR=1 FL=1
MNTMTMCEHKAGYHLTDGELCCVDCGTPSASAKWPENVYGVAGAKALHAPVEDKMELSHEDKALGRISEPEQKRLRGRPVKAR